MATILDNNLAPTVLYSDIYERGTIYIPKIILDANRGSEIPFVKDVILYQYCDNMPLPILAVNIDEYPVESMIAEALEGVFYASAVYVVRATKTRKNLDKDAESFVAIIGDGHLQDKQVQTCSVVLQRRLHKYWRG